MALSHMFAAFDGARRLLAILALIVGVVVVTAFVTAGEVSANPGAQLSDGCVDPIGCTPAEPTYYEMGVGRAIVYVVSLLVSTIVGGEVYPAAREPVVEAIRDFVRGAQDAYTSAGCPTPLGDGC